MKNHVPLFITLFVCLFCVHSQEFPAPSYNSSGPKIFLTEVNTNKTLFDTLKSFVNDKRIGSIASEESKADISVSYSEEFVTITSEKDNQVIYKIDNSKKNNTLAVVKDKLTQYAHGHKIKNLKLKNLEYKFSFRVIHGSFDNEFDFKETNVSELRYTNKILNFNDINDAGKLEVSNLSDTPIYFSVVEINSRGEITSFIPNYNCSLLGAERKLEPHQTLIISSCVFSYAPPYETITLKGFASAEPINFEPLIKNKDNASLDFIKDSYTEMYTEEFRYNIVNSNDDKPYTVDIDYYKPKSSKELVSAKKELDILKEENGQLDDTYINQLKRIGYIHSKLGNLEEEKTWKEKYAKTIRNLANAKRRQQESQKLSGYNDARKEAEKRIKALSRMTDIEKIEFYKKESNKKSQEIAELKEEINNLKKQLDKQGDLSLTTRSLRGSKPTPVEESPLLDYTYRALIIAEEDYNDENIKNLKFPYSDAKKLEKILIEKYTFTKENVILLKNPSRSEIFKAFDILYESSVKSQNDHLLIFYAGHGVYDNRFKRGYWLPSNAKADNKSNWISNPDIKDYITNINTKHTLLISDACFSGSIFEFNRDVKIDKTSAVVEKLLEKNARNAMTSGLDKPVPDESVFIKYLLKALSENKNSYLKASDLFKNIQEAVLSNTDNIPQYGVIKNSNHEGGEFIFLKKD